MLSWVHILHYFEVWYRHYFSDWEIVRPNKLIPFDLWTNTLELKVTPTLREGQDTSFCVQFVPDKTKDNFPRLCVGFGPVTTVIEKNCNAGYYRTKLELSDETTFWNLTKEDDKIVTDLGGVGRIGKGVSLKYPCHKQTVWLIFFGRGQLSVLYKPKGGTCGHNISLL